ncbi:MAG: hypothetical protein HWN81_08025 [Candidatus Lokiarchaeota archaeon]|nr:hypothetical protein [Candidatus Lokiarchaeota archaeon]
MMKMKKFLFIFLPLMVIALILIPNVYGKRAKVAYIYYNHTNDAESFKSLLDDNGFPTNLINITTIETGTFNGYDIIIIGHNTGSDGIWRGTDLQISIINDSDLPIIGLGNGGYIFFGSNGLNLRIGYNWGGSVFSTTEIDVINSSHIIFNTPNDIPSGTIQLYASGWTTDLSVFQRQRVYYLNMTIVPANIEIFGKVPSSSSRCCLLNQDYRYFLWGFIESRGRMTDIGTDLFTNVVNFYATEESKGISGYNLFILIGIISVSTIIVLKKKSKK